MTSDAKTSQAVADTLAALWSPLLAVTARHAGRANGLIAATGAQVSILPEAPRLALGLGKFNLTHDLVLASGVFALHLLPAAPDVALGRALELVRLLGFRSGHDGDKLAGLSLREGTLGVPILADALSYVEARVVATLDAGDETLLVAEVAAGERLREGPPLTAEILRRRMPAGWADEWARSRERQIREARRLLGR
jgi:flavin reductase (DIM6/NTAB) family NADH-FMN oxidoreductase RutF